MIWRIIVFQYNLFRNNVRLIRLPSSQLSSSHMSIYGCGFMRLSLPIQRAEVSVVPIPAAVWLFGSALAGLGFVRRRQATEA